MAALCARFALGALFIASGIVKLGDRASFAEAVRAFGFIGNRYLRRIAFAVPIVELGSGVAMAVGLFTAVAAVIVGTLTLIFTGVLVALLAHGRAVPCNCFGSASPRPVSWTTVARNLVIAAAATVVCRWSQPVLAVDQIWQRTAPTLSESDAVALLVATTSAMLAALIAHRLWRTTRVAPR
jgi:uncharacterized membrane protein YphA (DoxX/SURF4 family)